MLMSFGFGIIGRKAKGTDVFSIRSMITDDKRNLTSQQLSYRTSASPETISILGTSSLYCSRQGIYLNVPRLAQTRCAPKEMRGVCPAFKLFLMKGIIKKKRKKKGKEKESQSLIFILTNEKSWFVYLSLVC